MRFDELLRPGPFHQATSAVVHPENGGALCKSLHEGNQQQPSSTTHPARQLLQEVVVQAQHVQPLPGQGRAAGAMSGEHRAQLSTCAS